MGTRRGRYLGSLGNGFASQKIKEGWAFMILVDSTKPCLASNPGGYGVDLSPWWQGFYREGISLEALSLTAVRVRDLLLLGATSFMVGNY